MYTLRELAAEIGVSIRTLEREIQRKRLIPDKKTPHIIILANNPYVVARKKVS